jgi:DNA-binding response OmpR family regulator
VPHHPVILLVDDEAPLRELMKVTLGSGYRYAEAESAAEALELARRDVPAVMLLDVMLPGTSGLDLLRQMRSEPRLSSVRVVIVSAWQSVDDRDTALDLGADAFLAKPFKVEELVNIVAELTKDAA